MKRVFEAAILLLLLRSGLLAPTRALAEVDFATQIRPLLKEHCVGCHSEDAQESGLRLDFGSLLLRGGDRGPAVVPGKSSESLLFQALIGKGDLKPMPLDLPRLPAEQIELFRRWIDAGATIPADDRPTAQHQRRSEHWSFQPIRRPALPTIAHGQWPNNAIDYFVLARLETEGLLPAPDADRSTLIRRLSIDLLGVPPSVSEVEQFLNDAGPHAYERLVDRLLASPRYGERWGRHWMDIARYADSNGFTIDGPRSIWPYRDWAIRALNADLPFDEFVIDQLAGDLVPDSARDQLVATGFHRNTLINQEGGTDQEQFRVEAVVDRVNTTGAAFLGLTVGCAQCHVHKYDPISQREFYQLFAVFNNCDEPNIPLPTPQQAAEQQRVKAELAEIGRLLKEHDARRAADQPKWEQEFAALTPPNWVPLRPTQMISQAGATINTDDGERLLLGGNGNVPVNDVYTIAAQATGKITALRLEALTNAILPNQGPGWTPEGNFVLTELELAVAGPMDREPRKVEFGATSTDWSQDGYSIEHTLDGNKKSGWSIAGVKHGSPNLNREAIYVLKEPILAEADVTLTVTMRHDHSTEKALLGCFRLSVTSDPAAQQIPTHALHAILQTPPEKRSDADKALLTFAYARTDQSRKPLEARLTQLKRDEADLTAAIPTTMVVQERAKNPRTTHIHVRGDFLRKGAVVEPGVPEVLPPLTSESGHVPNRLDFSRWLFAADNPLTARVTVNRFWQQFFGTGLVETENDFGTQGSLPSHPDLLDWLASEFMRQQWSVKSLHRLIVTSSTYRQASHVTPELLQRDPYNRLLARQRRVRLEAEAIRDAALTASGLISQKMHGPGVYPPQPKGIYVVTQVSKAWPESQGDDRYRRGLYTYFWRSSPYPMLPTFDAPDANGTCTRRNRSNTPLQALTLANDGSFMEYARGMSDYILREASASDESRLHFAFRSALSRDPSAAERDKLLSFVERQRRQFTSSPELAQQAASPNRPGGIDEVTSATWTAVARVLLNLDEFITRE